MTCKNCKANPVIKLSNSEIQLCKNCFFKYFERKVLKTITVHKLITNKDNIGVAVSGGKDSLAVLYILSKICNKRKIKITAILIDEGIKDYRDKTIKTAKKVCKELKIKLNIYSFKKEFGKTLDKMKKPHPCSTCGVLRRYLLNKYAKKLKITKLATGHNLDDEAQSIIMNFFKRNIKTSARLGPITGVIDTEDFIKRIKPFHFTSEKETATYAYLKGFIEEFKECPYSTDSYRGSIRDMLNEFEVKYPGTKNNIITSFMEILPLLKKNYKSENPIKRCKTCKEPCSQEICQACKVITSI